MQKHLSIEQLVSDAVDITPFQRRVYLELIKVPSGTTVTYGELARRVNCRSARAIGQALRRNPFAVGCDRGGLVFTKSYCVPCHRVISSNGHIGGFMGNADGPMVERKMRLLEEESVVSHT